MAEKKEYPYNYRSFDFQFEGPMVAGCKYPPKASFVPSSPDAKNKTIGFTGRFNHESMEKPFYQAIPYIDFRFIIRVMRAVANAPGTDKIAKPIAFKFFKGGEFKSNGVTLGIVRDEKGLIYFAFKSKSIPTIPFSFCASGKAELLTVDGEVADIRESSKLACLTWCDHWEVMLNSALLENIEADVPREGGYNSGGSTPATTTQAMTPIDDDDLPF